MNCLGVETRAQHQMAAGWPHSPAKVYIYETGPLLSSANPVGRGAGGGGRGAAGLGAQMRFDCKCLHPAHAI